MTDAALLETFVATFSRLDVLSQRNIPEELLVGALWEDDFPKWRPIKYTTASDALAKLYAGLKIPGMLPSLFEVFLISYRWLEVDLKLLRLFDNPPGPDLSGFQRRVSRDRVLFDFLAPRGLFQFGMAAGTNYDPVCFDLNNRDAAGDCPVLQLDHEDILSFGRTPKAVKLADSFRELVSKVIKLDE